MKLFENNAVLFLIFNACTEFNDTFPNSEKEKERIREVSGLLIALLGAVKCGWNLNLRA